MAHESARCATNGVRYRSHSKPNHLRQEYRDVGRKGQRLTTPNHHADCNQPWHATMPGRTAMPIRQQSNVPIPSAVGTAVQQVGFNLTLHRPTLCAGDTETNDCLSSRVLIPAKRLNRIVERSVYVVENGNRRCVSIGYIR